MTGVGIEAGFGLTRLLLRWTSLVESPSPAGGAIP